VCPARRVQQGGTTTRAFARWAEQRGWAGRAGCHRVHSVLTQGVITSDVQQLNLHAVCQRAASGQLLFLGYIQTRPLQHVTPSIFGDVVLHRQRKFCGVAECVGHKVFAHHLLTGGQASLKVLIFLVFSVRQISQTVRQYKLSRRHKKTRPVEPVRAFLLVLLPEASSQFNLPRMPQRQV
jgi:hypothetical protein